MLAAPGGWPEPAEARSAGLEHTQRGVDATPAQLKRQLADLAKVLVAGLTKPVKARVG